MSKIAVIGGGISGLAAAYRLKTRGADVTVFEAAPQVGGLLGTRLEHGYVIETGADSILTEKPWAIALAEELGLGEQIIKTRSSPRGAYIVCRGQLERVPEGFSLMAPTQPLAMLRSAILSPAGKLRMAQEVVIPRRKKNGAEESLEAFVVRRFGQESFERLAQPLVGGIYGADPQRLSLAATMPRFLELERKYGSVTLGLMAKRLRGQGGDASGARYGLFAAFRGGMATFVRALEQALDAHIERSAIVTSVTKQGPRFAVEVRGRARDFSGVVVAVPSFIASQIVGSLAPELAHALAAIDYASAATVTFAFPRSAIAHPLDAFGFVVPAIEKREIIASTWASVKYEGRAPGDKALIRVFIGGHKGQHLLERSDDALRQLALRELTTLIGVKGQPEHSYLVRYERAMPQYCVGHLERVGRIEALAQAIPGFALAGNAYRGVGIPDAVKSGEDAAQRVLSI